MTAWLAAYMVQTSVLALLVLLVRVPVARLSGASWAYALWLVPALVPLLPALPMQFLFPAEAVPPAITILLSDTSSVTTLPAQAAPAAPVASVSSQWPTLLFGSWAAGILLFGLWQWLCYRAFIRLICHDVQPGDPPSFGGVPTLQSKGVEGL